MFMCTSSSDVRHSKAPVSMSARMPSSPSTMASRSASLSTPTPASIVACAIEPRTSCFASRRSKLTDSVNRSTSASVGSVNRPAQSLAGESASLIGSSPGDWRRGGTRVRARRCSRRDSGADASPAPEFVHRLSQIPPSRLQHRERDQRSRLGTQHPRSEAQLGESRGSGALDLPGSESAFGADEKTHRRPGCRRREIGERRRGARREGQVPDPPPGGPAMHRGPRHRRFPGRGCGRTVAPRAPRPRANAPTAARHAPGRASRRYAGREPGGLPARRARSPSGSRDPCGRPCRSPGPARRQAPTRARRRRARRRRPPPRRGGRAR